MQVRYLLQSYFLASFAFAWSHAVARAGVPWPQCGAGNVNLPGQQGGVGSHGKVWPFAESLGPQGHLELELEEQEISFQGGKPPKNFGSEVNFSSWNQIGNSVREILYFKSVY